MPSCSRAATVTAAWVRKLPSMTRMAMPKLPLRHGQADESLGSALGGDAAIAERHQVGDELTVPGDVLRVSDHRRAQPVERGGMLAPAPAGTRSGAASAA